MADEGYVFIIVAMCLKLVSGKMDQIAQRVFIVYKLIMQKCGAEGF